MLIPARLLPLSRLGLLLGLGGLLGGLFLSGCAPDSAGSSTPPDSTTVATTTSPAADSSAPSAPTSRDASASAVGDAEEGEGTRTVAQRLEDASTAARVKQALVRAEALRRFDFVPTVVRGHLTLRGDVDTRTQYRRAERVASNVAGVTNVTNQVTVQGRSVSASGDTAEAAYHTVRRGETLSGIARAYGVSVQRLRALNDLSGALQPGQQIRVR